MRRATSRSLGDGTFKTGQNFGVFLSVGSASGDSFKWPSWLPVQINAIGIEWPNFNADRGRFLITLSVSITKLPSVAGLKFSGAIEGLKIDPFLLLEGKFPIVDIRSIAVSVTGQLFGGELTATLLGGIMKFDAAGNVIGDLDSTTPVADRVLFFGIEGGFKIAGMGLQIRLGLSELGPLEVQIVAAIPVLIVPQIGLTLTNFTAGVKFFTTLPAIDDPFDLRRPEFSVSTTSNAGDWLTTLKQQVANQFRAIKANPGMSGFAAAFTSPMLITGGRRRLLAVRLTVRVQRPRPDQDLHGRQVPDRRPAAVPRRPDHDERQGLRRPLEDRRGRRRRSSSSPTSPTIRRSSPCTASSRWASATPAGRRSQFDMIDEVPNTVNVIRPGVCRDRPGRAARRTSA